MGLRITTWNGRNLYIPAEATSLLIRVLQLMAYGEHFTLLLIQH